MRVFSGYWLATATAHLCAAQSTADWKVGQRVKTTSGFITGHKADLSGNEEVSEYLGIPYAEPPVGPLRWKPPQPLNSTAEITATNFGSPCVLGGSGSAQSEDCLFLNVWTKPQTGEKKKAVLVSVHGGGFNTGSSGTGYLNGAPLANRQDVIVVSMNYRLSVFGFPGAPGLQDQNFGMLDIRAAVEWTRENIAVFGGDPQRITLTGESGGAGAVDYYAFAYTEDPIVAGLLPQSGGAWTKGIAAKDNNQVWYNTSSKLGCGGVEAGEKTTECVRGKSWQDILKYLNTGPRTPGQTFGPVYDEKIVFADYDSLAARGAFIKKPTFVGSTNNEGGLFRAIKNLTNSDVKLMTVCFDCVSQKVADSRLDNKVPVWKYRWFGDFPNNQMLPDAGAYHGSEMPFVFGTPKLRQLGQPWLNKDTPAAAQLTDLMMKDWADFAKDPEKGLSRYPQYSRDTQSLIRYGYQNNPNVTLAKGTEYDAPCQEYWKGDESIDGILTRSPANSALRLAKSVVFG